MPSIFKKEKVLDGRGDVLSYRKDPQTFFYREWIPDRRAYRSKKLNGAITLDQAKIMAVDVALEFAARPPDQKKSKAALNKKQRTLSIEIAVESFLSHEKERVVAGIIKYSTYRGKQITLLKHLIPYLKDQGVAKTRQINAATFNDYLIYRQGLSKLTWQNEIIHIKDFFSNWLLKHCLVEPKIATDKGLFPNVIIKEQELLSNPAISKKDWTILNTEIRKWVQQGSDNTNHRVHLWRTLFWTFVLIAKNSGARPEELMKLKWKDIEIMDIGRISQAKLQEEIKQLQAQGFDALVPDKDVGFNSFASDDEHRSRKECLVAYINLLSAKTCQSRVMPTNLAPVIIRWKDYVNKYRDRHGLTRRVSSNDLVFGNLNNEGRAYAYHNFIKSWRIIRSSVASKLEGHQHSKHVYTIFSIRSTFLENKLRSGLDIFLVSRISGYDPKMLLRHYQRIKSRQRPGEAISTSLERTSRQGDKVELFSAET